VPCVFPIELFPFHEGRSLGTKFLSLAIVTQKIKNAVLRNLRSRFDKES
jgi:hypothetical protein